MSEEPTSVLLYIYDLSLGLATHLSEALLNKKIDAIWHTSIVVYEREYYFGSQGIIECDPGKTNLGAPKSIEDLGFTYVTKDLFEEYLQGLRQNSYAFGTYNLLNHNCNTFSNELSQFLTGKTIPKNILELPDEILATALSQPQSSIANVIASFVTAFRHTSPDYDQLNDDINAARQISATLEQKRNKLNEKLEKQERRKKKKKKKREKELPETIVNNNAKTTSSNSYTKTRYRMSENGVSTENGAGTSTSEQIAQIEEQERKEKEERRKNREPPVIFRDLINVAEEFDKAIGIIDGKIKTEDMQYFEELHQYMLEDEGSWAISDGFLAFIGGLLQDQNFTNDLRVGLLNLLAAAALKEDIILVLHQDRREHVFMNYAYNFDRLSIQEQSSLSLFVCNLFENPSSSEWLLYISEWEISPGNNISNIRVTTKVAANALLSDNTDIQNYGSAIIHNLACKEVKSVVFDDVAVELTMALLQYFNNNPPEENLFRCMKALAKFIQVSQQEVTQLIQMIGPAPGKFTGKSERIDNYIKVIESKLR